jgi:hypothetical protein
MIWISKDLRTYDAKLSTVDFIVKIQILESYGFIAIDFVLQVHKS